MAKPKTTTERVKEFRERTADDFERLQLRLKAGTKAKLEILAEQHGCKSITQLLETLAEAVEEKKIRKSKKGA
jgi:hypothetical protein